MRCVPKAPAAKPAGRDVRCVPKASEENRKCYFEWEIIPICRKNAGGVNKMDKPKKEGKFALWVEDPKDGTGRLTADAFGMTITVFDAGKFVNDEGEEQEFEAGIKINNGKLGLKVSPLQAIMITKFMEDAPVKEEIKKRAAVEAEELRKNMEEAVNF